MLKKPKYSLFLNLLVVYLSLNFLLRFVFILHPITQSDFAFLEIIKIFGLGFLSDVLLFIVGSSLFWVYILFLSNSKYKQPWGYVIFGVLCLLLLYVSFFNTILNEYGGSLPEIGISFIAIKTVLFGLLLVLPQYRNKIRLVLFSIAVFLFVLIMVQNSVSEFFFWNEFGVRYNFIAVDYLVYTNAVIGNIMESYPVVPLFIGIGIITLLITYWIVKNSKSLLNNLPSFNQKKKNVLLYSILFSISLFLIPTLAKKESSDRKSVV